MSMEFTGERVVPGRVDLDLWNEHFSRYAFAARYCQGKRVLDAGCGTGYGSLSVSQEAIFVAGIDKAHDALEYGKQQYSEADIRWVRASCTRIPFPGSSFDTVLAFEVIEHLRDWADLISEARRVLTDSGVFLVSTPNKHVYAESRDSSGPNPYHEHEFELEEFKRALEQHFPFVTILFQNHGECVSFEAAQHAKTEARIDGTSRPEDASFYLAVCSVVPVDVPSFVYVPDAANLLRERRAHIQQLGEELSLKNKWLEEKQREHATLVDLHTEQTERLRASNEWAERLDHKVTALGERIVQLQTEFAEQQRESLEMARGYESHTRELENELAMRAQAAQEMEARLTRELHDRTAEVIALLDRAEATVVERTNWALALQAELEQAKAKLALAKSSRWLKLGRVINVGPELDG